MRRINPLTCVRHHCQRDVSGEFGGRQGSNIFNTGCNLVLRLLSIIWKGADQPIRRHRGNGGQIGRLRVGKPGRSSRMTIARFVWHENVTVALERLIRG